MTSSSAGAAARDQAQLDDLGLRRVDAALQQRDDAALHVCPVPADLAGRGPVTSPPEGDAPGDLDGRCTGVATPSRRNGVVLAESDDTVRGQRAACREARAQVLTLAAAGAGVAARPPRSRS